MMVGRIVAVSAVLAFSSATANADGPPKLSKTLERLGSVDCGSWLKFARPVTGEEKQRLAEERAAGESSPEMLRVCFMSFGWKFKDQLERQKANANCLSMFDIADDGRPEAIETRCNVVMRQPTPEWLEYFELLLVEAQQRAVAQHRYVPEGSGPRGKREDVTFEMQFPFNYDQPMAARPENFVRKRGTP